MRGNKKDGLSFVLGTFDDKKFRGSAKVVLRRKSQVTLRCKVLLQKYGHCWLKVGYGKGVYNDGVYKTVSDIKKALAQFTEKPSMDYIGAGSWKNSYSTPNLT